MINKIPTKHLWWWTGWIESRMLMDFVHQLTPSHQTPCWSPDPTSSVAAISDPSALRGGSGVAACRNVEVHCINMRKQPHVFTHRQIDVLEFQTCMAGVLHFRCETYLPGQLCHGLILTQAKISHKQQVLKYLARVRPLIASNIVKDQKNV